MSSKRAMARYIRNQNCRQYLANNMTLIGRRVQTAERLELVAYRARHAARAHTARMEGLPDFQMVVQPFIAPARKRPMWAGLGVSRLRSRGAGVEDGREATKQGDFREPERIVLLGT